MFGFTRAFWILLVALASASQSWAAIYGADNRLDIFQIPIMRPYARAVAIAVPNNFLHRQPDGAFALDEVETLEKTLSVCPGERFYKQTAIPSCTGFLVAKKYLITAGHCILPNGIVDDDLNHPYTKAFSWYFDYNVDAAGKSTIKKIPADRIYHSHRVVRAENIDLSPPGSPSTHFGRDFAVIELDREVSEDITPLATSARTVAIGDFVFALGYPSGLPAKFSGWSPILDLTDPNYFSVNLDSQAGNSGSPTFNDAKQVIGILVSGHQVDYVETSSGCNIANRCNEKGDKCTQDSTFDGLQISNYIQYIAPAMEYVPRRQ